MAGDGGNPRFGAQERGVQDPLGQDDSREEKRRRAALASTDASLAQLAYPDYTGDVFMLIAQAESTNNHSFQASGFPRLQKQAAAKLLSIYRELLELAAKAPRDPKGVLLRRDLFGDLVPWSPAKPRSVAEIPVFSRDNLLAWTQVDSMPEPPPPPPPEKKKSPAPVARQAPKKKEPAPSLQPQQPTAQKNKFAPNGFSDEDIDEAMGKPKRKPEPPDPDKGVVFLNMIKIPQMSYTTEVGRLLIYSAVIRALLAQNIADDRAMQIVLGMEKIEDTITSTSALVFDTWDVGSIFLLKLHPSFFEKLAAAPEFKDYVPKPFGQRLQIKHSSIIYEIFPDFTDGERFFYAAKLMRDSMGANKGPVGFNLVPGRTYDNGCVFLGFGSPEHSNLLEPAWLSPDGRVFLTVEREALLEGFRQGVLSARGSVIMGYAEIAIAGAILLGPEVIVAAGEAVGAGEIATAAGMTVTNLARAAATTTVGRFIVVNATGVFLWLGQNWERVVNVAQATQSIGQRIYDQGLKGFFKSLVSGNPKDIIQSWAALLHDAGQGYSGYRGSGSPGGRSDDDEPAPPPTRPNPIAAVPHTDEPSTTQAPVRPVIVPDDTAPVPNVRSSSKALAPDDSSSSDQAMTPNGVVNQMVGSALQNNRSTSQPANSNRMTNPSCQVGEDPDAAFGQQQQPLVLKATGTGGPVIMADDNQPVQDSALGTSATRKTTGGSTPPKTGTVKPSSTTGGKGGGSTGGGGGGGKGPPIKPTKPVNDNSKKPILKSIPMPDDEDDTQATSGKATKDKGTQGKLGSSSTPGGRGTGAATGGNNARATKLPIRLSPAIVARYKLTPREVEIIEAAAEHYIAEMAKRAKMPPDAASTEAHAAVQDKLTGKKYPEVTVEDPTGVTGEKPPKNESNLKTSDLQISRQGTDKAEINQHVGVVLELKRTVGLQNGKLVVKGRDFSQPAEYVDEQVQGYEIMTQEQGIPVLVIDRNGKIYAPGPTDGDPWVQVGGPTTDKK